MVIKGVEGHPRVEKERDILLQFHNSIHFRQMIDEIYKPAKPATIVLEYLDADLAYCSDQKTLSRKELKYVSKRILQGLQELHAQNYVHTGQFHPTRQHRPLSDSNIDVKLMNVLVNLDQENLEIASQMSSLRISARHVVLTVTSRRRVTRSARRFGEVRKLSSSSRGIRPPTFGRSVFA